MKLSEAFEIWRINTTDEGSYKTHRGKIKKYIDFVNDDIEEINNTDKLREFIFNPDQKGLGKYSALYNFYEFIQIDIFKRAKNSVIFPIDRNEVVDFDASNFNTNEKSKYASKREANYLIRDFDFMQLFDDKFYNHISCEVATLTVKSAIALGLAAGYDSGEMFKNNTMPSMTVHDIHIYDDNIMVTNFNKGSLVKEILIPGKLARYVTEYYNLRMSRNNIPISERELFFPRLWESKDLKYDSTIDMPRKPYLVQELVYYMLRYISRELKLSQSLSVTDLRSNMVLHSLYSSKGSSLIEIIKVFGFPTFVERAFEEYCKNSTHIDTSLFNDKSFFELSPSDEFTPSSDGDKKNRLSIINQIVRDSSKVKELKKLYNNVCQVCGQSLTMIDEVAYSEACHIQPLGGAHNGVDDKSNMLIMCPNHHKLFDLGVFSIDPSNLKKIVHVDDKNTMNDSQLYVIKHNISPIFIRYHYEKVFLPLKEAFERSEQ